MGHFSTVNRRQGQHHQSVRKTADYRTRKTAGDQRKTFNLHLSSLFKHSDLHEDTCCIHILAVSQSQVLLSFCCQSRAREQRLCHLSPATGDKPGSLLSALVRPRLGVMQRQHSGPQDQLQDLMDSTLIAM